MKRMSKCLVLNFKNTSDKKVNIYIPHVKANVSKDTIIHCMELIYNSKNLFEVPLKECCGAFYIKGKNNYINALEDDFQDIFI